MIEEEIIMKKNVLKFILIVATVISTCFMMPAKANEIDESSVLLFNYNNVSKFQVEQNGYTYILITDAEYDVVGINNYYFTADEFWKVIEYFDNHQIDNILSIIPLFNTISAPRDYNEVEANYNFDRENKPLYHSHDNLGLRCFYCQYDNFNPPTSGYKQPSSNWLLVKPLKTISISMTTLAITTLAGLFFGGAIPIAKAVMGALVGFVSDGILSSEQVQGSYYRRQTFHTICPNAVKEEREVYVLDDYSNIIRTGVIHTDYFYTVGPNG